MISQRERDIRATREAVGAIAVSALLYLSAMFSIGCVGRGSHVPQPIPANDCDAALREHLRDCAAIYHDAATNPKPTVSEQFATIRERLDAARKSYGESQKRHLQPIIGDTELTTEAANRGFTPIAEAFERAAK